VIRRNVASIEKELKAVEAQKACHKEVMEKELAAWLDLELNRKMLEEHLAFLDNESERCAVEFKTEEAFIDDADIKLDELEMDLEKLKAAVLTQLSSLDEISSRADKIVRGYSHNLEAHVAQNLYELKKEFDEYYELMLRRRSNLALQQQNLNKELRDLNRKMRRCSRLEDTAGEQKLKQQWEQAAERLKKLNGELEQYSQQLSQLDVDWEAFFMSRLEKIQGCSEDPVYDERDRLNIVAQDRLLKMEEQELEEEREAVQYKRNQIQSRRTSIDERAEKEKEKRQLLTCSTPRD
jgi:hypothetical protein